jgi:hypothetical protein
MVRVKAKWMSEPAASDERVVLRTNHFCLIMGCARKRWRNKHWHDISVHIDIDRVQKRQIYVSMQMPERVVQERKSVQGAWDICENHASDV